VKAFQLLGPGSAAVVDVPAQEQQAGDVLLKVLLVGMCGTDLTSFRGGNAMLALPRILGHEVAAVVVEGSDDLVAGTLVTLSPYTSCGECASCRGGRPNACRGNQTLGVQRDGAMRKYLRVTREKIYVASLSPRELALVEPLTVGMHAVSRGRVTAQDVVAVFGCGGVGLGAIAGASFRGAEVIAIDMDDRKLEVARKAGAKHVIHSGRLEQEKTSLHERLAAITGGHGPNVCIEAIGSSTAADFPRGSRGGCLHGSSGVHRLCEGAGELRDPAVCAEGAGHSGQPQCAA
jgi:threonine dehydrogenase-like Zn-dependent dehydrogenase